MKKIYFLYALMFLVSCVTQNPWVLAPVDGGYDTVRFQDVSWNKKQIVGGYFSGHQVLLFYDSSHLVKKEEVVYFAPMNDPRGSFMVYQKFQSDTLYIVSPDGKFFGTYTPTKEKK